MMDKKRNGQLYQEARTLVDRLEAEYEIGDRYDKERIARIYAMGVRRMHRRIVNILQPALDELFI
jgi:hypothetical protein